MLYDIHTGDLCHVTSDPSVTKQSSLNGFYDQKFPLYPIITIITTRVIEGFRLFSPKFQMFPTDRTC